MFGREPVLTAYAAYIILRIGCRKLWGQLRIAYCLLPILHIHPISHPTNQQATTYFLTSPQLPYTYHSQHKSPRNPPIHQDRGPRSGSLFSKTYIE